MAAKNFEDLEILFSIFTLSPWIVNYTEINLSVTISEIFLIFDSH